MAYYSFIDETGNDSQSNFDTLIEYKVKDFKDFTPLVEQLSTFRKQVRGIHHTYNETYALVKNFQADLQKIDDVYKFFLDDEEWRDKVMDLKNMYIKLANYDEIKKTLDTLDEQKSLTELISNEFKIQLNEFGLCPICTENRVSLFLDPCGHVSCDLCWEKTRRQSRQTCPCCRTTVNSTKKMFLI